MSKSTLFFRETLPSSVDLGAKVLQIFHITKYFGYLSMQKLFLYTKIAVYYSKLTRIFKRRIKLMKQKYASLQKYAKIKGISFVFGVEEYSKAILVPKIQKIILK